MSANICIPHFQCTWSISPPQPLSNARNHLFFFSPYWSHMDFVLRFHILLIHTYILSISATRERIRPESATQSCTYNDNEDKYAAEHAIDLNLTTYSKTCRGSDGSLWLQLKLDQVYCVEQIRTYKRDGKVLRTLTCSNTDCSHCEGINCSWYSLSVSTEEAELLPVLDCKYGDTVKLQYTGKGYSSLMVYEISVTGEKGDISLV